MVNELRDLDGSIIARGRAFVAEDELELRLCDTTSGQIVVLTDLSGIQTLRDLCDELLAECTEE